ncbi:MAG: hypothetical protein KA436_09535 [Oligoflexales bacterium]|nr:hypothetical protein [Oligoflexales bacterium]
MFLQLKKIVLTFIFIISSQIFAKNKYQSSFEDLSQIVRLELDPQWIAILDKFEQLPPEPERLSFSEQKELILGTGMIHWSSEVHDYLSLVDLLFTDLSLADQNRERARFDDSKAQLELFVDELNRFILKIHPQFSRLQIDQLQKIYDGRGIKVAVFDIFDAEILDQQRLFYAKSFIHPVHRFGNPVRMQHGNSVIDVLLKLAPALEIIPVSSDARSYAEAMHFMNSQQSIDIVNFSRSFAPARGLLSLDPLFFEELSVMVQKKILCKALGNTGTDLDGKLSLIRQVRGLGFIDNLFSYDLALIKEFSHSVNLEQSLTLFAVSLDVFGDENALTTTIPGLYSALQARTLSVPAEGVWSQSVRSFESGTSFAAPQLAAFSALLLQDLRTRGGKLSDFEQKQHVIHSLSSSADRASHAASDWGLGLPSGVSILR